MKLLFKPDLKADQPSALIRPRHLYKVNVSLVVISDADKSIGILTTHDGHLPSTPLLATLEGAIRDIITTYTGHTRRGDLIGSSISQMEADIELLRQTERIFGRAEDRNKQAMLAAEMHRMEETIRKLKAAEHSEEDIEHLIPDAIRRENIVYNPEEGFPVILSEAYLKEDQLELVFAAGAGILGGREPKEGLAIWGAYQPADDETDNSTQSRQIRDAVDAFISPLRNKGTRIEEGLKRAFTLNKDLTFGTEATKRSIELLSGEAIPSSNSLFRNFNLSDLSAGCDHGKYRKPVTQKPRQPPDEESGVKIQMPTIGRILIKYSSIPDLRVAIARPQPRPNGPLRQGLDDTPEHSPMEISKEQRLFDFSVTDAHARQVIDALVSAADPAPAARPGRNIMTLQLRKREREFFLRSFAEKARLHYALKMIPSAPQEEAEGEEDKDAKEKAAWRVKRLADLGFERIDREGACNIWVKDITGSGTSTEPLKTELFVTTGSARKPMSEAAVREAAAILHALAHLSRDAYEMQAGKEA